MEEQRQYNTDEQLRILHAVAKELGLFAAADRIERTLLAPYNHGVTVRDTTHTMLIGGPAQCPAARELREKKV